MGICMDNVIADRVLNMRLTKGQKKIADYCIRNPEEVGMCSSMELAHRIGVSDASITRFARAIGYEGFVELKNDLYNHMAAAAIGNINNLPMAERYILNRSRFPGQVTPEEFGKATYYNIERTIQQCGQGQIERTALALLDADHRYIVGCRGTIGVAKQCTWLLGYVLEHVLGVYDGGPEGLALLGDIGPEDCLLFFSVSRYYKMDLQMVEFARSRSAKVCLVTDSLVSPMVPLADEVIAAETQHVSFFNSMSSLSFIVEYLAYLISQKEAERYQEKANERDALTACLRLDG